MRLERVGTEDIVELRAEKLRTLNVPLLPNFHLHLAAHADTFAVVDAASTVGYALLLFDRHEGHDHVTLIEAYLTPPYRDRYEDLLELIETETKPRAYLARSDDCTFQTALIAMGFPMEVSMAVLVARTTPRPDDRPDLGLVPLDYPHLRAAHDLIVHVRGVEQGPTVAELEREIEGERVLVLTHENQPIGVVMTDEGEAERYCLVDVVAPHVADDDQVWALQTIGRQVAGSGRTPAAVVDSRDAHKLQVFRKAGYYTASTYLIFYDAEAGRPSVPTITREELWEMMEAGEEFHLIDALGEDHWMRGHLPGSEWIDFRALTREARKRFAEDEPIVVYCNDYT